MSNLRDQNLSATDGLVMTKLATFQKPIFQCHANQTPFEQSFAYQQLGYPAFVSGQKCTFFPMFTTVAEEVQNDFQKVIGDQHPPNISLIKQDDTEVSFSIQRQWNDGTRVRSRPLGTLCFLLNADCTIVARSNLIFEPGRSMRLDKPDRQWVSKIFEMVMIAALKASAH